MEKQIKGLQVKTNDPKAMDLQTYQDMNQTIKEKGIQSIKDSMRAEMAKDMGQI